MNSTEGSCPVLPPRVHTLSLTLILPEYGDVPEEHSPWQWWRWVLLAQLEREGPAAVNALTSAAWRYGYLWGYDVEWPPAPPSRPGGWVPTARLGYVDKEGEPITRRGLLRPDQREPVTHTVPNDVALAWWMSAAEFRPWRERAQRESPPDVPHLPD